ncbi:MAG: hypothetical protein CL607_15905 [Anaerolineaceae bacterium]|nr:hypothetical protein [Anaerolineaceae bacterium]
MTRFYNLLTTLELQRDTIIVEKVFLRTVHQKRPKAPKSRVIIGQYCAKIELMFHVCVHQIPVIQSIVILPHS